MDYNEIIDLALSYADRTDSDIVSRMPDFVLIVEARIGRALRVNQMSTRSLILSEGDRNRFGLPVDFGGVRDVKIREVGEQQGITAHYLNPEQSNNFDSDSHDSYAYTIMANQIQIYPTPPEGTVLEIVYYKLLTHLKDEIDHRSNWLSEQYPDCYVFGLIVEIESFVKNARGAEMWNARLSSAITDIGKMDQIDRWSGTPLTVKVG